MKKEDKINAFKSLLGEKSQYGNYLAHLRSEKKWNTTNIEQTVKIAKEKIDSGIESFVIYGEPQCGKTAMMVGLTSKLIDDGHNLIIILLNDSLRLLRQNLDRFREVSLNPTPKKASDIDDKGLIDPKYVLFCKKNINDLKKLNLLVKGKRKVIIDDEADYASPNSNVNKEDKDPTAINNAIKRMIDDNCIYIGVTATPARLDLNNTFNNDNEQWVYYEPHRNYVGKEEFFLEDGHYKIKDVSRTDEEGDIQKAILSFIVNVININFQRQIEGKGVEKYCFLIHQHYKKKRTFEG